MTLSICSECGRKFKPFLTAEERLLGAIYGEQPMCKKCSEEKYLDRCSVCNIPLPTRFQVNGKAYCAKHIPQLKGTPNA